MWFPTAKGRISIRIPSATPSAGATPVARSGYGRQRRILDTCDEGGIVAPSLARVRSQIRKPLKYGPQGRSLRWKGSIRDANQVRFICTLVLGSGFVASLYIKDAAQHVPTSGNRTFVGEWVGSCCVATL